MALDAAGDVFVADNINARVVSSPPASRSSERGAAPARNPASSPSRGIAADPAGDTYVTDTANGRIAVFDPNGNLLRTIGTSGRGPGQLVAPEGLAVDPTGSLFVSDTADNRVERFSAADVYLGQWGGQGGHFNAFNAPAGIAVDPRGAVYVADRDNGRLARIWGDGTFLSELGGPLQLGGAQLSSPDRWRSIRPAATPTSPTRSTTGCSYTQPTARWRPGGGAGEGDGAAGSGPGQFVLPEAVAVGPGGEVFVADTGNDRVDALSPTGAVQASWGERGDGQWPSAHPDGIAVDAAGGVRRGPRKQPHPGVLLHGDLPGQVG